MRFGFSVMAAALQSSVRGFLGKAALTIEEIRPPLWGVCALIMRRKWARPVISQMV